MCVNVCVRKCVCVCECLLTDGEREVPALDEADESLGLSLTHTHT